MLCSWCSSSKLCRITWYMLNIVTHMRNDVKWDMAAGFVKVKKWE